MSSKKAINDETKGIHGKSRVRKVPDFSKLHQQWTSRLEQRKALSKKPCTIPMEFAVTPEKGTFGRVTSLSSSRPKSGKSLAGKTKKVAAKSPGQPEMKFKANRDALQSILSEEGITNEVTPPKQFSMYYRAGEQAAGNIFKTPAPKSVKKPSSFKSASASALKKLPSKPDEPEVKFEKNKDALSGILNDEGIKRGTMTPRHFSMYCRTGQPLNSVYSPGNILKSAKKTTDKKPKQTEEKPRVADVPFEANEDALKSILNEKGISFESPTPKYHSMYCRTGQPLKTPQQSQSVRKSIYYQVATSNPKDTAQKYSRQLTFEYNHDNENEKSAATKSYIKTAVAVPIRNSVYKKYCFSPVVKVTPSPRKQERTHKSAAKVCWAKDDESQVQVALPKKLTFDDVDSPCEEKENKTSESASEMKSAVLDVPRQSPVKSFSVHCDDNLKDSPTEQPKSGALCPRSPNVSTPPRPLLRRDLLHHNSPLKAVVSNKPRYYCPASPRLEHQVSSVTDLINKENMSPKRPTVPDKEVYLQTEMLKGDVMDLSVTLNESILMYDQLQEEADQLLSKDLESNIILMKLEKIRAKQQKLLKMEEFLKRRLKCKQDKVTTKSGGKEKQKQMDAAVNEKTEDAVAERVTRHSSKDITCHKDETSQVEVTSHTKEEVSDTIAHDESPIAKGVRKPLAVANADLGNSDPVSAENIENKKAFDADGQKGAAAGQRSQVTTQKGHVETNVVEVVEEIKVMPVCVTPKANKIRSTPKSQDSPDSLVIPTPVRSHAQTPPSRAYLYPTICTPLSMRERTGVSEPRRDSLGRSPDTPEDVRDSYSIDKSVDSASTCSSPIPSIPFQNFYSPTRTASPMSDPSRSPLTYLPGTPVQLYMTSPGSPVRLRGSLSLAGNVNFARPTTPGKAAGLLLPAAVHRYHDALLDDEVSLYMCRLKMYGNSRLYAENVRTQDPVAEVLTIGDEMHFIPVSSEEVLLGFSFQPLEGSAFSILKSTS